MNSRSLAKFLVALALLSVWALALQTGTADAMHRGTTVVVVAPTFPYSHKPMLTSGIPVVPAGCVAPPTVPGANEYYASPTGSDSTGNGTIGNPYAAVDTMNSDGKLASLPRPAWIHLMSGNQGSGATNQVTLNQSNSDFVTIDAAAGQTPVIGNILLSGGNFWAFHNLTVQHVNPNTYTQGVDPAEFDLVNVASGSTHDVYFSGMTIQSVSPATLAGYTTSTPGSGGSDLGMYLIQQNFSTGYALGLDHCFTSFQDHVEQTSRGYYPRTNTVFSVLISSPDVGYNASDFINYVGHDWEVVNFVLHDSLQTPNGDHRDFIQGLIGNAGPGFGISNILVHYGDEFRRTNATFNQYPATITGTDDFDGPLINPTFDHIYMSLAEFDGIYISGATSPTVTNNIITSDTGLTVQPGSTSDTCGTQTNPANTDSCQYVWNHIGLVGFNAFTQGPPSIIVVDTKALTVKNTSNYNSGTGLVTLNLDNSINDAPVSSGWITVAGLTGTGANLGSANGHFLLAAPSTSSQVTFTIAMGLTITTITGGTVTLGATNLVLQNNFAPAIWVDPNETYATGGGAATGNIGWFTASFANQVTAEYSTTPGANSITQHAVTDLRATPIGMLIIGASLGTIAGTNYSGCLSQAAHYCSPTEASPATIQVVNPASYLWNYNSWMLLVPMRRRRRKAVNDNVVIEQDEYGLLWSA